MQILIQKQQPPQKQRTSKLVLANKALSEPDQLSHPILRLQRVIGNKAIQNLLQGDPENFQSTPAKVASTQLVGKTGQIPCRTNSSGIQPIRINIAPGNNHLMRQPRQENLQPFQLPWTNPNETYVLDNFASDSAELTPDHQVILQRVAADLNANPVFSGLGRVRIEGYADRPGANEYNRNISQRRADAVRNRLSQLLTNQATRSDIQTYPQGAPLVGPIVHNSALRAAIITIYRRSHSFNLDPSRSLFNLERPPILTQGRPSAAVLNSVIEAINEIRTLCIRHPSDPRCPIRRPNQPPPREHRLREQSEPPTDINDQIIHFISTRTGIHQQTITSILSSIPTILNPGDLQELSPIVEQLSNQ